MASAAGPGGRAGAPLLQHRSLLQAFFRRRLREPQDAEDYVQEVFRRVLSATEGSSATGPVSEWRGFLLRTAANLVAEGFRRRAVRAEVPLDEAGELAAGDAFGPERIVGSRQQLRLMSQALAELPPVRRQCFLLARMDGLPHREIAERMGIERVLVSRHIERATVHLARRLKETT